MGLRCRELWALKGVSCPLWQAFHFILFFYLFFFCHPVHLLSVPACRKCLTLLSSSLVLFKSHPSLGALWISWRLPVSFSPLAPRCFPGALRTGHSPRKPRNTSLHCAFHRNQILQGQGPLVCSLMPSHGRGAAVSFQCSPPWLQSLRFGSWWPPGTVLTAFLLPFYPRLNSQVAGSSHAFSKWVHWGLLSAIWVSQPQ